MQGFKTVAAVVLSLTASWAYAGTTLNAIKEHGFIKCGISDGLPGFSFADEKGNSSPMRKATTTASMWTFAAPSPPPCSATPPRSNLLR